MGGDKVATGRVCVHVHVLRFTCESRGESERKQKESTVISESLCISKLPFTGMRAAIHHTSSTLGWPKVLHCVKIWGNGGTGFCTLATPTLSVFPNGIWRIVQLWKKKAIQVVAKTKPWPAQLLSCLRDWNLAVSTSRLLFTIEAERNPTTTSSFTNVDRQILHQCNSDKYSKWES